MSDSTIDVNEKPRLCRRMVIQGGRSVTDYVCPGHQRVGHHPAWQAGAVLLDGGSGQCVGAGESPG